MATAIMQIMAMLVSAFPQAKIEAATLGVYQEALADIPPDVLRLAVLAVISRSRFWPTVAEIREEATKLVAPALPSPIDAWAEVLAQIAEVHFDGTPVFSHPLIGRVALGMGWRYICLHDDASVARGQFLRQYQSECERAQREALLQPAVRDMAAQLQARWRASALPEGER
jgi:hypothetical protein